MAEAMKWIVGVSKHAQESWAVENIQKQGYDAYYPQYEEEYIKSKKTKEIGKRVRSLFPRYVFIRTDGPWYFLENTFGMSGVVPGDNGFPAIMPDWAIDDMKAREDSFGLVKLPEQPQEEPFRCGQRLKVIYGPMQGFIGICQRDNAKDRVRVLLDFLGQRSSFDVARTALVASAEANA